MQTPDSNNYEFHEDAGHGWLRVPYAELAELGVQPSEYSYMDTRREFAYLEEDMDMGLFLEALDPECIREIRAARARGEEPKINIWDKWHIKSIHDGNQSWIRDLDRIGKITPQPKPPTKEVTPDSEKGKAFLKMLNETAKGVKAMPETLFPEIFYKWGICTESEAERKGKGTLGERTAAAIAVLKRLKAWKTDDWYLMPVVWLETKATEAREKADLERAERIRQTQEAEAQAAA